MNLKLIAIFELLIILNKCLIKTGHTFKYNNHNFRLGNETK